MYLFQRHSNFALGLSIHPTPFQEPSLLSAHLAQKKGIFQTPCWNPVRSPNPYSSGGNQQLSPITRPSAHKGQSFNTASPRLPEKSWDTTGGKWNTWSCRGAICAQTHAKFHKTQHATQAPRGPPSCTARNPFFFSSWFLPCLCGTAAFIALLFSQLVCLPEIRSPKAKGLLWS